MTLLTHTVEAGVAPTPVQAYLHRAWPAVPALILREALRRRDVRVNGLRVSAGAEVRAGDEVRLYVPDRYGSQELRVVYCGAGLLCLEKPQGLPVDADGAGVGADTLLSRARERWPEARLCHRLDAGTGGAILLATEEGALGAILAAFRSGAIGKTYAVAVSGRPAEPTGALTGYIRKDASTSRVRVFSESTPGAKTARTDYRLLATVEAAGAQVSFLEADIHTGRTHQIRAQLAQAGLPVVGDDKYGSRAVNAALHARWPSLWCRRMILPEAGNLPVPLRGLVLESEPAFPLWKQYRGAAGQR